MAMLANPDIGVTQIAHRLGDLRQRALSVHLAARTANTPESAGLSSASRAASARRLLTNSR